MGINELITSLLILLGTGVMILSVLGTRRILSLVEASQYQRGWRTLFVLMIFFAAGYLAALWLVVAGVTSLMITLTGVIFFFGALFVYIVVRIGFLTISELTASQKSLTLARDEALEASRLKSELLARVSHELRTPLHAILGYTEMLDTEAHGPLSDKQRETVKRMGVNTERLMGHINNMLHQARIEAGELTIHLQPMAPADLLDHVDLIVSPLAAQQGLSLVCQLDEGVPETLLGDVQRLQEIVTNLAGNAVKFTTQGQVKIRLYRPDADHWAIEVTDTGPGIPAPVLPTIFDPFRQVDGTITRRYGGTGLGLSIVKQVTEMMGGQLDVQSEVGHGTCFTVVLPLLPDRVEVPT